MDCFRTGHAVTVEDLPAEAARWPRFAEQAALCGFVSVHALPMRLRSDTIGTLNLFNTQRGTLATETLLLGQALADVATIGILQARAIDHYETLAEQLQTALNNRVVLEQAKGVISERRKIDMDTSFALLRDTARGSSRRLSDLCRAIVEGTETL
ncbi:ANTAR domain-containing protein [Longispora urticae]